MVHNLRSQKTLKKRWFVLVFFCLSAVIFYKPLFLMGCKVALHRLLPETPSSHLSYETMRWEKGDIVISGLVFKTSSSELYVDQVALKPKAEMLRLCFRPEITLTHPQIHVLSECSSSLGLAFLYQSRFVQPKWRVKNGVLHLPSRFYFSLEEGSAESLGTLLVTDDPNPEIAPMLSADLMRKDNQLHVHFKLQESHLSRFLSLSALIMPHIPRNWAYAQGEVELEGMLALDSSLAIQQLHFQGEGKKIDLRSSQMGIDLNCEHVQANLHYPTEGKHGFFWDQLRADMMIQEGFCRLDDRWLGTQLGIKNLEGQFCLEPNTELSLTLNGIAFQPEREIAWMFSGKGGAQKDSTFWTEGELLSTSDQNNQTQTLWTLHAPEEDNLAVHFKMQNIDQGHLEFLRPFFGLPGKCTEATAVCEGTLFFKQNCLEKIVLENTHVDSLHWAINDHAQLTIQAKLQGPAEFFRNHSSKWTGTLQLSDMSALCSEPHLDIKNGEGKVLYDSEKGLTSSFYAECEGIALRGNVALNPGTSLTLCTSQIAGDLASLQGILIKMFPVHSFSLPLCGNFSSGESGFVYTHIFSEKPFWSFQGSLDNITFPLNAQTSITEAQCSVLCDSKTQQIIVENGKGTWTLLDGTPLCVQLKKLSISSFFSLQDWDFSFKVTEGKKEFAQIDAKIQKRDSQWELLFDAQKTHLGGAPINITRCTLDNNAHLIAFDMQSEIASKHIAAHTLFLQNTGFIPTFAVDSLESLQMDGNLQLHIFSEDIQKGLSLHAKSADLKMQERICHPFYLAVQKNGNAWHLDNLESGPFTFKGSFDVDTEGLTFPQWTGSYGSLSMKGNGYLKTKQKTFACTIESMKAPIENFFPNLSTQGNFIAGLALLGDFSKNELLVKGEANFFFDIRTPFPIIASNQKGVRFSYKNTTGLQTDEIDVSLKHKLSGVNLGHVRAKSLKLQPDFFLSDMVFSLNPVIVGFAADAKILPQELKSIHLETHLEGTGELHMAPEGSVFQGTFNPGLYGWGEQVFSFEQIQWRYEKDILGLRARIRVEEEPLWASLQIDLAKEPYGVFKIFDDPKADGLKFPFHTERGRFILDGIQGACYGLDCMFAPSAKHRIPHVTVLTGRATWDGNCFKNFLPKELQLGSGYAWEGDLVLFHNKKKGFLAKGILTGSDFEALGYRLAHLEAQTEVRPHFASLSNLQIEDESGSISIPKVELHKEQDWHINIPQVLVTQMQPSKLRNLARETTPLKPFTIKNFTLTDVQATLGDLSTLQGSGSLSFVNQSKKESSIFNVPLEMLKKVGLDIGLLTPIQGELQVELRGDKFYLISLDNAFSEGARSEFYLLPGKKLSYIDLAGKMHINLKMRQDVMLKITEPFTLTIRGTLDNPRYGLQF